MKFHLHVILMWKKIGLHAFVIPLSWNCWVRWLLLACWYCQVVEPLSVWSHFTTSLGFVLLELLGGLHATSGALEVTKLNQGFSSVLREVRISWNLQHGKALDNCKLYFQIRELIHNLWTYRLYPALPGWWWVRIMKGYVWSTLNWKDHLHICVVLIW